MYKCNDEELNQQMKSLYDEYNVVNNKRIKNLKIYDAAYKRQKYLIAGTVISGFIFLSSVVDMPQVYLACCLANPINLAVKSIAEVNKNSYEEELEKIKIKIKDLEYKMYGLDSHIERRNEIEKMSEELRSEGLKLSKHHDFRYTEYEAYLYEKENDLRYNPDRYGIHRIPFKDRFRSELTGDYENPVFVLIDNKGKVITKRRKYPKVNN